MIEKRYQLWDTNGEYLILYPFIVHQDNCKINCCFLDNLKFNLDSIKAKNPFLLVIISDSNTCHRRFWKILGFMVALSFCSSTINP